MFKVRIRSFERGLLFRHGDFVKILKPGVVRLWSKLWTSLDTKVTIVNTLETRFQHPLLDLMLKDPAVRDELTVVDLVENERALVWIDGRFSNILGPGRHAFWKQPYTVDVEIFDTDNQRFEHAHMDVILENASAKLWLTGYEVADHEFGLLFKDGELVESLKQGRHVFWGRRGRLECKTIDRREQVADVAGQEIMTRDKVTLRVNLVVSFQVTDAVKAVTAVSDYAQALYREAQLALRSAIGTRTLDALLADKDQVSDDVSGVLVRRADEFGVAVRSVGLRDVILPGEMKTILNQVIEAEKQAQANVIKRREETAAARSQANTAKLMAENPVLARMKELEAVQDILSGAKVSVSLGQGDLLHQIKDLVKTNGQ